MLYSILSDLARVFHCEICWIRTRGHCIRGFRESVKTVFIIFLVQKLYFIRFWTVKTVRQIVFKYCEENCEKNPCILYSSWLKADTVSAYSIPWPCGQYCIYRFCTQKWLPRSAAVTVKLLWNQHGNLFTLLITARKKLFMLSINRI